MSHNFAELAPYSESGRAYTISGTGRNRNFGYRKGILCKLGDIEETEWIQMARECISENGEEDIHAWLLEYIQAEYLWLKSPKEREREALKLHMVRIFDNEQWVGFIPFNRKYRPDVLEKTELVHIRCSCCGLPGDVTKAKYLKWNHSGELPCPICGVWSTFTVDDPSQER